MKAFAILTAGLGLFVAACGQTAGPHAGSHTHWLETCRVARELRRRSRLSLRSLRRPLHHAGRPLLGTCRRRLVLRRG